MPQREQAVQAGQRLKGILHVARESEDGNEKVRVPVKGDSDHALELRGFEGCAGKLQVAYRDLQNHGMDRRIDRPADRMALRMTQI